MSLPVYHYSTNLADGYEEIQECLAAKSSSRISSSAEDILIILPCTDAVMYTAQSLFLINSMLHIPDCCQLAHCVQLCLGFLCCMICVVELKKISHFMNSNYNKSISLSGFVAPDQQEVVNIFKAAVHSVTHTHTHTHRGGS